MAPFGDWNSGNPNDALYLEHSSTARRQSLGRGLGLPRVLVLDNGKELHPETLQRFLDLFTITIRWRRASMPRDSAMVERMLGATEQEVRAQLG